MATQASAAPSYHVLQYKYVPDILEKRGPFREKHLELAGQKRDEGKIVLAGALTDPVDTALFIWKNASQEEIEQFVKDDVYVNNKLVTDWSIRPWMVMIS
ncbi:g6413 [Coccomyxa viridis]|uniref:G6413 protein n=1 Tax=Coccomyxa viridis TaxID=1274662 RepID=A0ABP1FXW5_9CHLO